MAQYKFTYFFEAVTSATTFAPATAYGWTETLYSDIPANLEAALAAAKGTDFLTNRAALLQNGAYITWVRVSQVGGRAVKLAYVGHPGNGGAAAVQTTCAALLLLTAAPTVTPLDPQSRRRAYLIRGLSSDALTGDRLTVLGQAALGVFATYLLNGPDLAFGVFTSPWRVAYIDTSVPWRNLTNAQVLATDRRSLLATIAVPVALNVGDRVQTRRIDQPRGANRTWTVSSQTPDNSVVTIGKARRLLDSGNWPTATGQMRQTPITMRRFTNFVIGGTRTKKTGRPFKLPVGRRRAGS